jgi:hypothetical protein
VAFRGGLQSWQAEAAHVASLRIGHVHGVWFSRKWHQARRRKGFGGEHPFRPWSRYYRPESQRVGYAPLESQTKRWARESQIEGWFPPLCGERHCYDVIRIAMGRLKSDGGQLISLWKYFQPCRPNQCRCGLGQSGAATGADAGYHTKCIRQVGEVRLDILPHRRTRDRLSGLGRSDTLCGPPFAGRTKPPNFGLRMV